MKYSGISNFPIFKLLHINNFDFNTIASNYIKYPATNTATYFPSTTSARDGTAPACRFFWRFAVKLVYFTLLPKGWKMLRRKQMLLPTFTVFHPKHCIHSAYIQHIHTLGSTCPCKYGELLYFVTWLQMLLTCGAKKELLDFLLHIHFPYILFALLRS